MALWCTLVLQSVCKCTLLAGLNEDERSCLAIVYAAFAKNHEH